jgi:hypothetical protein
MRICEDGEKYSPVTGIGGREYFGRQNGEQGSFLHSLHAPLTSLIPITPTTDTFTWALDKTSYYSIILGYHVIED